MADLRKLLCRLGVQCEGKKGGRRSDRLAAVAAPPSSAPCGSAYAKRKLHRVLTPPPSVLYRVAAAAAAAAAANGAAGDLSAPCAPHSVGDRSATDRSSTSRSGAVNEPTAHNRTNCVQPEGVVGHVTSGKSALVHRYLTGCYMYDESPEGGRFKKEVVIDGQSYLLLIRDEGGPPELQFSHWVDAVVLVFSLDSEHSLSTVCNYYNRMAHYRGGADLPVILVGTQDAIGDGRPRMIDEGRVRKLAHDIKPCAYYETCATYGLNVERVFREACHKILAQRALSHAGRSMLSTGPPPSDGYSTPSTTDRHHGHGGQCAPSRSPGHQPLGFYQTRVSPSQSHHGAMAQAPVQHGRSYSFVSAAGGGAPMPTSSHQLAAADHYCAAAGSGRPVPRPESYTDGQTPPQPVPNDRSEVKQAASVAAAGHNSNNNNNNNVTPSITPNAQRKNRRISNIFRAGNRDKDEQRHDLLKQEFGSGRAIPVKQGHLYKRSSKALNKEWKKKYVCLYDDGRLVYHANLKDYMDDAGGKELFLGLATVKPVCGAARRTRAARQSTQPITVPPASTVTATDGASNADSLLTAYEFIQQRAPAADTAHSSSEEACRGGGDAAAPGGVGKKKRAVGHKRAGSNAASSSSAGGGGAKCDGDEDSADCEFVIITADTRQWHMEAASGDERHEWMSAMQSAIGKCIEAQSSHGTKAAGGGAAGGESRRRDAVRALAGNGECADCGRHQPDWVSLNIGVLICIECSGVHRQLGSHISRIRSLTLDDWPREYIGVLHALGGNAHVKRIYEARLSTDQLRHRPNSDSSRECKESWIRAKYERRAFIAPLPVSSPCAASPSTAAGSSANGAAAGPSPVRHVLIAAVLKDDARMLAHGLAYASAGDVNCHLSAADHRTPLHLACSNDSPACAQLLLWANADIRAVDQDGQSALWYARQGGSTACGDMLLSAGLAADYGMPSPLPASTIAQHRQSAPNGFDMPLRSSKLQASVI